MKQSLGVTLCTVALLSLCGCGTAPVTVERQYTYEYTAQVLAMPSCRATMVKNGACYAEFKSEDGRTFTIGSPGASREVAGFIGALQEGTAYDLPDAFMEYQKQQRKTPNQEDAGNGK